MKTLVRSVLLSLSVIGSSAVVAQDIDSILEEARSARAASEQLFNQRAAQFDGSDAATRQRLLGEATTQRDGLATQVEQRGTTYSENDLQIASLNRELRDKANALGLGEAFGIARQHANDSMTPLQQSLVGAQFPDNNRVEFLASVAGSNNRMLTIEELERLWEELTRELVATGQVAKFNGSVVLPGGSSENTEVVRIGPFIATSQGRYLAYIPELNRLTVLPRQLPAPFDADARNLTNATSGYVQATVDGTRGVLLSMYVERPTLEERIELGEEVGYLIIFIGVVGILLFILQLLYLIKERLAVARQIRNPESPSRGNPLGRVLLAFRGDGTKIEEDADILELRLSEAVMKEIPALERVQAFLRLAVAAGPLLGLVGTVVGMIITFQSITETGSSDPKIMATGIGQAMIATVLGLGVAVPLLFGNALLTSLSKGIMQILDEQSAGILAETLEKRRNTNA